MQLAKLQLQIGGERGTIVWLLINYLWANRYRSRGPLLAPNPRCRFKRERASRSAPRARLFLAGLRTTHDGGRREKNARKSSNRNSIFRTSSPDAFYNRTPPQRVNG